MRYELQKNHFSLSFFCYIILHLTKKIYAFYVSDFLFSGLMAIACLNGGGLDTIEKLDASTQKSD